MDEPFDDNTGWLAGARNTESALWLDEIHVAVELPMGPPGPEGPEPSFGVDQVLTGAPGGTPAVRIEKSGQDGIWYFDFLIPAGPEGLAGQPGPPWDVLGTITDISQLPPTAALGDAWILENIDGTQDIYVYGSNGWQKLEGYKGLPGDPTYAWVNDTTPPENPVEGQIWFRPSAQGYVPTSLRVDGGLQFDQYGGHIWGTDNGSIAFGLGELGGVSGLVPQATLGAEGLDVRGLMVGGLDALTLNGGVMELGSTGRIIDAVGRLQAQHPIDPDDVATKGYVDGLSGNMDTRYVNAGGDTMTGNLNIPPPSAPAHATTKKYVDDAVAGAGLSQAQADARYVNIGGDTMSGHLNVPNPSQGSHAVNLATMNNSISNANVHRINGFRVQIGTYVINKVPSNGRFDVPVIYPIEHSVIVSNGHYDANPSSVRIQGWSGAKFTVSGMIAGRSARVNWIAA